MNTHKIDISLNKASLQEGMRQLTAYTKEMLKQVYNETPLNSHKQAKILVEGKEITLE